MKASVIGRIRNTNLPRSKALLPLFEAVVNAFHAIEEVLDHPNPLIRIDATREPLLDKELLGDFESFSVIDNGSGFNERQGFRRACLLARPAASGDRAACRNDPDGENGRDASPDRTPCGCNA